MAATLEPPPAPAAPVSQPAQAAQTTIRVAPSSSSVIPTDAPAPGSARERMYNALRAKAKPDPGAEPTPQPAPNPAPQVDPQTPAPDDSPEPGDEPAPGDSPQAAPAPATNGEKPKKANPWKMVDEYKAKVKKLEQEIVEARNSIVPEEDRKSYTERTTKAEARAKELEDHIRYVDYSKSEEFNTKYVQPYEKAWDRAAKELSEIHVTDPGTDTARAATTQDLLALVNLPLGKAREMANAIFGDFADDVMAHRKEIRGLFEAQTTALDDAKKNGSERVRQDQERFQMAHKEITKFVADTWKSANDSALKDEKYGKYFNPVEGNQEINQRLAKGFELVDRAFSENPLDPKLTPEERRSVVRRHSAVKNRAAAFGRVTYELEQERADHAETKKELAQFKQTTPTSGASLRSSAPPEQGGSALASVLANLRSRAK